MATFTLLVLAPLARGQTPRQLRKQVYSTDPYLARIVDREDPCWDPTVSFGGCTQRGRHDVTESYGLCQADPGTRMASAGPLWRTDAATQLRWCRAYALGRYGSERAAWQAWQRQGWW